MGGPYVEEVDGKPVEKYRPWQVDKTAFTFHLIAGFQAQQKQIDEMLLELAALKAR